MQSGIPINIHAGGTGSVGAVHSAVSQKIHVAIRVGFKQPLYLSEDYFN